MTSLRVELSERSLSFAAELAGAREGGEAREAPLRAQIAQLREALRCAESSLAAADYRRRLEEAARLEEIELKADCATKSADLALGDFSPYPCQRSTAAAMIFLNIFNMSSNLTDYLRSEFKLARFIVLIGPKTHEACEASNAI